jgi:sulfur carrier protein ThiS
VKIQLHGHLNFFDAHKRTRLELEIEDKTGLKHVLELLGVPSGEVAVALVNGHLVPVDTAELTNSDMLELYPPAAGG